MPRRADDPLGGLPAQARRGPAIRVRDLGLVEYEPTWQAMKAFTARRHADTDDEIWLLQHPPVYTQGLSCDSRPPADSRIPVVATDRGGQITYHGPGQVVAYALIDIKRRRRGPKWLVELLEQAVIELLAKHGIDAGRRPSAPGVYVAGRKIAALGLRVRKGAAYHGVSLNVDMDLAPFRVIDPCGYPGLEVTQVKDLVAGVPVAAAQQALADRILDLLSRDEG